MIVTKRAIPRRTVLRGLGTALALPVLDAMVPAFTAQAKSAAAPPPRIGFVYTPNGYMPQYWVPKASGTAWETTPSLRALEKYRHDVTVITGLAQRQADSIAGDARGPHSRATGAWLTGVHVKQTEGADVRAAQSTDQIAAGVLGRQTPMPSLELAIEQNDKLVGNCEGGYTCVYQNTVSWRDATTPMPVETNPRVVFDRLFGDGSNRAAERKELGYSRSILDAVTARIAELQKTLGTGDRQRLGQYLDSVRDIESRITRAEARSADLAIAVPERPIDIPSVFEDHVRLMFDLQALAYQADLTRVISFMIGREQSARAYPNLGIADGHHPLSHHAGNAQKIQEKAKIDAYHVELLTYYIERLKTTPDGDGTLLDHVVVLYGASLGEPNTHDPFNLPNILIGSGGGRIKLGRHLAYPVRNYVPQCNMLISLLGLVGVPLEHLGDSTGALHELTDL
jgi:hypothetical protein